MKNKIISMCLLLSIAIFLYDQAVWSDSGSQTSWEKSNFQFENRNSLEYVPGEILVKFKEGTRQNKIGSMNSYMRAQEFKRIKRINVHCLKLPPDISVDDAVAYYKMDPNVEYAEPNYIYHFRGMPNDSDFSILWGLHNTGQQVNGVFGTMDADIDAPEAWDITTGSDDVIIAVIDSGVAYLHPEIKPNTWINTEEFTGSAGIDDDNNGYVDDIYGWDFYSNDNNPTDYYFHGTHISGTIAAFGNNGSAITGVNWKAKIMALRVGSSYDFSIAGAADAIGYAVDNGASIINASWGGFNYSDALFAAISDANDNGVIFVVAAGNGGPDGIGDDNDQSPDYPSGFDLPNIISVAATDQDDNLTSFSNFGLVSVDVGAPGENIYSTVPVIRAGSRVVLYSEDFDPSPAGWVKGGTNSSWAFVNGTGVGGSTCLEDSPGGNYLNNTDSYVGYNTPFTPVKDNFYTLSFELNANLERSKDFLLLKASIDGYDYEIASPFGYTDSTGGLFKNAFFDLTNLADILSSANPDIKVHSFYFGFGLYSNSSITRDGVYIDNITLYREPMLTSGYGYTLADGTSMAAPCVAGVAGLVKAQNPAYNHLQIRDAIFNTVDKLPPLIGKVATEGRINAFKAVTYIAPPSNLYCTARNGGVALNWNANSESAVKGYIVSYGENASLVRPN